MQTVILTFLLNLVAFALVSLALRTAQIEQLHHVQRQTYWLARSESLTILKQLQMGQTPTSHTILVDWDKSVVVSVTAGTTQISVTVTAKVGQSSDKISFSFNPSTQVINSWLDASS